MVVTPYICSKTLHCVKHPVYTQASKGKMLRSPQSTSSVNPSRAPILDLTVLIQRRGSGRGTPVCRRRSWMQQPARVGAFPSESQLTASLAHTASQTTGICLLHSYWNILQIRLPRQSTEILRRIIKIHLQHSICYQPPPSSALQHNRSQ